MKVVDLNKIYNFIIDMFFTLNYLEYHNVF
jgi:hypothetical protein